MSKESELESVMNIRRMPIEAKMIMLSDSDKDYLRGYIDRALVEQTRARKKPHVEEQDNSMGMSSPLNQDENKNFQG
ncbi:MAG: hypothetical protein LBI03_10790 [Clostridiales bacterium]|nr:hypothetical protein [Clostridiales bacterium]